MCMELAARLWMKLGGGRGGVVKSTVRFLVNTFRVFST